MEHLFNHLIQRHVIPVLLLPVAASGCFCFALLKLPETFRSSSSDMILLLSFSLLGLAGTAVTFFVARAIHKRPATWRVFELGRAPWLALVCVAWLLGVGCGVLMLYETSF